VLAVHEVVEKVPNRPPTADDDVQVGGGEGIDDPEGVFALPLKGLQ
jgi:hypothetical protein